MFHDLLQNKQILYQLVAPKAKKKSVEATDNEKVTEVVEEKLEDTEIMAKPRRRRGRPRKDEVKRNEEERTIDEKNTNEVKEELPCSRTRYGRVSRPPKHMSKFIDVKEHLAPPPIPDNVNNLNELINQNAFNPLQTIDKQKIEDLPKNLPIQSETKKKRNIDRFKCGICKKVQNLFIEL